MGIFGTGEDSYDPAINDMVDNAIGDSVSGKALTSTTVGFARTGFLMDHTIASLLDNGETPHAIFPNLQKGISLNGNNFTSNGNYRHLLVVTDARLLFLIGDKNGDRGNALRYSDIDDVQCSTGMLKHLLKIRFFGGTIEFHITNTIQNEEVLEVRDYIATQRDSISEGTSNTFELDSLRPIWLDSAVGIANTTGQSTELPETQAATPTESHSSVNLIERLRQMDSYEFEKLVADLWERQGWEATVSDATRDGGIDIVAIKYVPFEQKQLIQAKRHGEKNYVGAPDVQQYSSLHQQENNVDTVVIVTTGRFSKQAVATAEQLNVKLIDGEKLIGLINQLDARNLAEKYTSAKNGGTSDGLPPNSKNSRRDQLAGEFSSPQQASQNTDHLSDIYVSKLVDNATGRLVTRNRLTKRKPGMSHPQTLGEAPIHYLIKSEQPHFMFRVDSLTTPQKSLDPDNGGYLVATDRRVVLLVGHAGEDVIRAIPYNTITSVRMNNGFAKRKFYIQTDQGEFIVEGQHTSYNESGAESEDDIDAEFENMTQFIKEMVYKTM
ncbi:restriction endonuclease [Halococcus thailandensis]|uniref:Restriction endonuclease n=1 Tax=Halococcus thailandensis JCM 13552 TaxID=1227457 RepID=M0MS69_9EURY|nr:restriction endonuclease [Halococcus thailandensis]EMA48461.1 restriction endonuclease [Halococcus thailandensis JCM 13552]